MHKKTAGELSLKALSDQQKYDSRDVADGLSSDFMNQVRICIENNDHRFSQNEYCIVMLTAEDCLLKNLIRQKFYAWPWLPKPRPNQTVLLYNRSQEKLTRLWVLPPADTMVILSELEEVHKQWETMQAWSKAFFAGRFWEFIRWQHNITMLSEHEYLLSQGAKLASATMDQTNVIGSEPFDFSKVDYFKVIDSVDPVSFQNSVNPFGQTQHFNANVSPKEI